MKKKIITLLSFILALAAARLDAQPPVPPPSNTLFDKVTTQHSVQVNGKTIGYTATAGVMPIRDESGKPLASIFYVAYTQNGVVDKSRRPLLIAFNGGPGSSSVWLHMGFLGPRRVAYDPEGKTLPPPYRLENNEQSILDEADILFIDPVATGFSRMAAGEEPHKFHGVMEDLQSVAEFIRLYVTRNGRWESPKFVMGESYGTTRAAGLTAVLLASHRMTLNGTILLSSMNLGVNVGSDVDAALILPHYTATAWYHKKLPQDLQGRPLRAVLDESEKFALGEFLLALVRGNGLGDREKTAISERVARYTGLSAEFVRRCNLRVGRSQFRKELLRDRGMTVGRLDSRYTGVDRSSAADNPEYDPAMADWNGGFTAAVNQYLRSELKYETDLSYNIFGDVGNWRPLPPTPGMRGMEAPSGVGEMLRSALMQNPFQKVLVMAGYYDAGCDYFSAEYAFSHLDPAGAAAGRIRFAYYECGHMMYIRRADREKAKKDLADFIRSCLPR